MNNNVVQIDQYPLALSFAFDTQRLAPCSFGFQDNLFGHGLDMPCRITGRDDKPVRQRIAPGNVELLDVNGFKVFQSGDHQVRELFGCQWCGSSFIGQMKIPGLQ